jgi:hypothetical protein
MEWCASEPRCNASRQLGTNVVEIKATPFWTGCVPGSPWQRVEIAGARSGFLSTVTFSISYVHFMPTIGSLSRPLHIKKLLNSWIIFGSSPDLTVAYRGIVASSLSASLGRARFWVQCAHSYARSRTADDVLAAAKHRTSDSRGCGPSKWTAVADSRSRIQLPSRSCHAESAPDTERASNVAITLERSCSSQAVHQGRVSVSGVQQKLVRMLLSWYASPRRVRTKQYCLPHCSSIPEPLQQ